MDEAALDSPRGERVRIGEFLERFPSNPFARAVKIFCPTCSEETHVVLSALGNRADHFAHFPSRPGTPLCRERQAKSESSKGYYDTLPFSERAGDAIRAALRDPKTAHRLWTAANVILEEQFAQPLTSREFFRIAKEVDRLGRWNKAGTMVDVVPFIILNHGEFRSGRTHILFPIMRDNQWHRPMLTPVKLWPDGTKKRWRGYRITPEETSRLVRGRPVLQPGKDALQELQANLQKFPPDRRQRKQGALSFE